MRGEVALFAKRLKSSGMDQMILGADRIIVAFSGGADSCLLLFLLHEYLKDTRVILEAAHLNHMIRGDEAVRDEDFCRTTAEGLGIKLHTKRVDIPSLAKNGGSIEEVARRERYAFFREICDSLDGRVLVATAHNADDHLETVLFNLIRGSGAVGMCGIPQIRDGIYIRPMLQYLGGEIREACERLGIIYVCDSTNFETEYTRNKIRAGVVPTLCEIVNNPQLASLRMSASLRADNDYLDHAAEEHYEEIKKRADCADSLASLHDAILSRVLGRMYKDAQAGKEDRCSLEWVHLNDIMCHLREGDVKFKISVPGNMEFFRDGSVAGFARIKSVPVDREVRVLEIGVPTHINGYVVLAIRLNECKTYDKYENIYNLSIHKDVSFDKIKGKLNVRCRACGDTFRYGGITRRVKKLFSERHMRQDVRERLPIIADDEGILWIPGFPARDGSKPLGDGDAIRILCFDEADLCGIL